jgi:hypothetical protein
MEIRTSQKVLQYDHLKTFRRRNYNHFIIVIQLQIMYNPKRTFIVKLLYVVKELWQPNLDSSMMVSSYVV